MMLLSEDTELLRITLSYHGGSGWQDFKRKRDAPISGRGVWVWKIATDPSASPPAPPAVPQRKYPSRHVSAVFHELHRAALQYI